MRLAVKALTKGATHIGVKFLLIIGIWLKPSFYC
jgi:hypothetical protein